MHVCTCIVLFQALILHGISSIELWTCMIIKSKLHGWLEGNNWLLIDYTFLGTNIYHTFHTCRCVTLWIFAIMRYWIMLATKNTCKSLGVQCLNQFLFGPPYRCIFCVKTHFLLILNWSVKFKLPDDFHKTSLQANRFYRARWSSLYSIQCWSNAVNTSISIHASMSCFSWYLERYICKWLWVMIKRMHLCIVCSIKWCIAEYHDWLTKHN